MWPPISLIAVGRSHGESDNETYLLAATSAAALAFGPAVVLAQSAHDQAPSMKNSASQNTHNKQGMRAQIRDMLQNAGFTDIHVMPGSFVIHAKDKDGNPVVMNVSPELMH